MKNDSQKEAFINYEADEWFKRNRKVIESYNPTIDKVISLITEYNLNPNKVLEIGCSGGYRLNAIHRLFPSSKVFGIDPSEKANEYCTSQYPNVSFKRGTADDLSHLENESIDIVIVGFVFYVVDRNIFFKVVSEIDRVLKNGGILIIVDFFSETALKNTYEHIKEFSAFSYKQNYDEVFTASKLYYLLDKSTWSHSNRSLDASNNYYNKYSVSLLKKDTIASYK